jgi:hypothetical protein
MTEKQSHCWTDVDFTKDGKQVGFIHLPYSVTKSAYGHINIPITVIRNGEGPRALVTAGIHGDEFEGQIAVLKLASEIQSSDVRGCIVLLPAVNQPAALAGTRVSPLDDGNLNRLFPGDADGTPTSQIAYFIDTILLPGIDAWFDLHSGGNSLNYEPLIVYYKTGFDEALDQRAEELMRAFGSQISIRITAEPDTRFTDGAAYRRRIPFIGGEFGGGGSVNLDGAKLARDGVMRALQNLGILSDAEHLHVAPRQSVALYALGGHEFYVYSPEQGLFEPVVRIGDTVSQNQLCGHIRFVENMGRDHISVYFRMGGRVVCIRHPGRTEPGDCLAHTVVPIRLAG